ncbi:MAG: type II toxin-antitoxin system VapC family toxin [Phycisphaerales bacterium]|nr:type II toxin-antitoxin system VapC family toxin [Phycisphaerales bacterium]
MELVVVDASVAAKWVLTEADTGIALDLLNGSVRCTAPALIRIEVAGAVVRRLRGDTMTLDQARAACAKWDILSSNAFVRLIPQDDLLDNALDIALSIRHAVPDCLYLAAAAMLGCRLITADRVLHERGRQVHERIDLLARAA